MTEVIKKRVGFYSLYLEEDGSLYLEVLCGTVGMYFLKFQLHEKEVRMVRESDKKLEELAEDVRYRPEAYWDRMINE